LESVNFLLSLGVIALLLAMIFKYLPDTEVAWGDAWIGAAVASLLLTIGKALIGLYLARSTVASAYGAAGSLVIILTWVYYSAQILLLGAEVTHVYANHHGSRAKFWTPGRASGA
jgi:membrane protein